MHRQMSLLLPQRGTRQTTAPAPGVTGVWLSGRLSSRLFGMRGWSRQWRVKSTGSIGRKERHRGGVSGVDQDCEHLLDKLVESMTSAEGD